jgi:hypothetical protein
MSERPDDETLPAWMADALRRPIVADPAHAARITEAVRTLPRPRRALVSRRAARPPRWALRRGMLAPGGGALLAAVLTVFLAVGRGMPGASPVPTIGGASAIVLRDTVLGDALQDTLRLVRVALSAPGAVRVAVADTYPGRDDAPTTLRRDARTGAWSGTVMVARDVVQLALVVESPTGQ